MSNTLYTSLPPTPSHFSAGAILARFIDAIGFRFQTATNGLTESEIYFCPVDGSMDMMELVEHIYGVFSWAHGTLNPNAVRRKDLETFDDYRNAILEECDTFKKRLLEMSDEEIENTSIYLKRTDTTYSVFYLINGPISDVLTHVGQIASWRRIAGNPVERISPFTGKPY